MEPLFFGARALIVLYRDTVPTVPPGEPKLAEPMGAGWGAFTEELEARDIRITLLSVEPRLDVTAGLGGLTQVNATLETAECTLAPVVVGVATPAEPATHALRLTCAVGDARLERPLGVQLTGNATLLVEYSDATQRHEREVVLRTSSSDPADLATSWDGMEVLVAPEDSEEAAWSFPGARGITVQTPYVAVVGRLRLPPASGRLVWAQREMGPRIPELDVTGSFVVSSYSERFMDLRGSAYGHEPDPGLVLPPAASLSVSAAVIVAGVGAAAVLAYLARGSIALLFTRLTHDRALDHSRRAAIADAVAAHPGSRIQDVAKLMGLHKAVTGYHVRVLERQGVLVLAHWGRHTALFLRDRHPPSVQKQFIQLRRRCVPEILERLRVEPEARQGDIARDLGVSRSRVAVLVKELEEAGLLRRVRQPGGRTVYDVEPLATPIA